MRIAGFHRLTNQLESTNFGVSYETMMGVENQVEKCPRSWTDFVDIVDPKESHGVTNSAEIRGLMKILWIKKKQMLSEPKKRVATAATGVSHTLLLSWGETCSAASQDVSIRLLRIIFHITIQQRFPRKPIQRRVKLELHDVASFLWVATQNLLIQCMFKYTIWG